MVEGLGVRGRMHGDVRRESGVGPYVPALDGIRALAVVAVLLFHAGVPGTSGGYLGVSLFFTLSGFLMGSLLLRERGGTGRIDYMRFWERRCRRLLPAALVTLGGVAVLAPHLQTSARPGLRGDLLSALGYVANWRFVAADQSYASLFDAPNPVQHFWSLAIEEQFYLLFPLLIGALFFVGRGRRGVVVGALAALTVASVVSQFVVSGYDRAYYGTDTRAAELLAGALLACALLRRPAGTGPRSRRTDVLGVAALAGFVALVVLTPAHPSWLVHGGFGAVAIVNVALIGGALAATGPVPALLGTRPLVAIGKVSYGLYLYHWPVFLWLDGERTGWTGARLLGVRLAVTVVLAVVSYHLLECPIRYRRRLAARPASRRRARRVARDSGRLRGDCAATGTAGDHVAGRARVHRGCRRHERRARRTHRTAAAARDGGRRRNPVTRSPGASPPCPRSS